MNPPLRFMMSCQQHLAEAPAQRLKVPGREMWLAADMHEDGKYTLIMPDLEARTAFTLRSLRRHETRFHRPLPEWANYVTELIPVLIEENLALPGFTAVVAGDEPPGPRYQYATGMALAALAYAHHEKPCDEATLLALMQQVQQRLSDHN